MKQIIKRPSFIIGIVVLNFIVLFSLYRIEQTEQLKAQPQKELPTITVHTSMVNRGSISNWIAGEGNVQAVKKRHMVFQASGKVLYLGKGLDGEPLREGSWVKGPDKKMPKGTLLARLDNRELQKEIEYIKSAKTQAQHKLSMAKTILDQSKKDFKLASTRFERGKQLFNQKIKSLALFEEDEAAYLSAQTEMTTASARVDEANASLKGINIKLEQINIRLENSVLYAPFDGIIARLNISDGDHFEPSAVDFSSNPALMESAPITIIDPKELELTLNIPLFDGMDVKPAQKSIITWESMDWNESSEKDYFIEGHVYSVSPMLNVSARSVRVKVRAKQETNILLHGMFVTCWIEVDKKDDALLIPTSSLLFKDDSPYVYVVTKGTAQQRKIKIGLTDDEKVEVISGVKAGDQVVTKGRYRLFENIPVNVSKIESSNDK